MSPTLKAQSLLRRVGGLVLMLAAPVLLVGAFYLWSQLSLYLLGFVVDDGAWKWFWWIVLMLCAPVILSVGIYVPGLLLAILLSLLMLPLKLIEKIMRR